MLIKLVLLIFIVLSAPFYACADQINNIVLGVSNATSGPASQLGSKLNNGAKAFFNKLNKSGGIHGQSVELQHLDDSYEPYLTKKNTQSLLTKFNVFALFNYVGTPTSHSIYQQIIDQQIIYLTPFTGAQFLREPLVNNIVHLRASYRREVEAHVKYLVEDKKIRDIGIMVQADQFGAAVEEEYIRALAAYGLSPVVNTRFRRNTLDIHWALSKLTQSNAQAIGFAGTYKPLASLINKATQQGFTPFFMSVSFVSSQDLFSRIQPSNKVFVSEVMPEPKTCRLAICDDFINDMDTLGIKSYGRIELEGYVNAYLFSQLASECEAPLTKSCFLQQANQWHRQTLGKNKRFNELQDILNFNVELVSHSK